MNKTKPDIWYSRGPSLRCEHKAVIVTYESQYFGTDTTVTQAQLDKLPLVLTGKFLQRRYTEGTRNTDQLLAELIRSLMDFRHPLDLSIELSAAENNKNRICIEYIYKEPVQIAISLAFAVVSFVKSPSPEPQPQVAHFIRQMTNRLIAHSPTLVVCYLMTAARNLNIPFYALEPCGSSHSFGQGKYSFFMIQGSSESNSNIGHQILKSKIATNDFVKMAGYPTTEQYIAGSLEDCLQIVDRIGYPVTLKPPENSLGNGVTPNIRTPEQLAEAFNFAGQHTKNVILVEKHVPGDDYRIATSGDWVGDAVRRIPPQVTGNGKDTIKKLIELENEARKELIEKKLVLKLVSLDHKAIDYLKIQGYTPDSVLEKGKTVNLTRVPNISSGGKRIMVKVEDIHPDVVEMVKDIARLFRMETIGFDYITPDITKSWREVGTIIEINANSTLNLFHSTGMLSSRFSHNNGGRIKSLLIISDDEDFATTVWQEHKQENSNAGFVGNAKVFLDDGEKLPDQSNDYNKYMSLLIDKKCESLVIALNVDELVEKGLPIDQFDRCIIDQQSSFNAAHVTEAVFEQSGEDNLEAWLQKHIKNIEKR